MCLIQNSGSLRVPIILLPLMQLSPCFSLKEIPCSLAINSTLCHWESASLSMQLLWSPFHYWKHCRAL